MQNFDEIPTWVGNFPQLFPTLFLAPEAGSGVGRAHSAPTSLPRKGRIKLVGKLIWCGFRHPQPNLPHLQFPTEANRGRENKIDIIGEN